MKKHLLGLSLMMLSCSPVQQDILEGQWIDLTHDFSEESVYWPTATTFKKTTVSEGYTEGGYLQFCNIVFF
jgi:hypothetical protein